MKDSFEHIVQSHINLVYFFAKRWLHTQTHIDDVVQQTFLNAMKKYDTCTFKTDKELKSWLLAICRNNVMNYYRSEKPTESISTDIDTIEDLQTDDSWLEELAQQQDIEKITTAIQKLESIDQEIIKLKIYEELSFKEIGFVFNMKESRVKMRFYRSISKLRALML